LTCGFRADVDLDAAAEVTLGDTYLADRVGWREMTADGDGVRLLDSPVPVASVSDELRKYPADLLASPVDVRSFTVATEPGVNTGSGASIRPGSGDPFTTAMAGLDRRLEDMIGDRALTPLVGAAAVLLALLLGVGHALLPGHGKTVMAAYLAGRRGRSRDALAVGATVTLTHTVGVLVLGLALSVSSSLAGDQVIRWAGVVSGLLVAGIGAVMLRNAVPRLRRRPDAPAAQRPPEPVLAGTSAAPAGARRSVTEELPDEQPAHGHHHEDVAEHGQGPGGHSHGPGGHSHGPGGHSHGPRDGRGGLIGMGVAGGLVPSPSALIVLMASIGLGRTVFGVFLVLAYGLGMAGTLTAVGLSLVRLRGRLDRLAASSSGRSLAVLARVAPVLTATLVLVVGLALVLRGAVLSG
jgi:ABC-type nickel/cobalt efflux system permease component RcnA